MKKHSRGFTLIELLVVVAIIGILSTIVLAALGQARQRARQTSAKATISQIRAQAELDGDFDNVCGSGNSSRLIDDAVRQGGYDRSSDISCQDSTNGYAIWLDVDQTGSFLDTEDFCIDSTGFAGQATTAPGGNQITCR